MWKDVRYWGGWVQLIRKLGVNWELRAERRRQPEGAWEVLAGEGTELLEACTNTRETLCTMAERGGRGSCQGLWLEKELPCSQEGRQLQITHTAVQDCMEISPEQGL